MADMTEMPLKVRTSKFRHVFGQPTRKENCYENIRITKNAHDSNFCAVNTKFLAVVTESVGGGAFLVHPLKQLGRVEVNSPKVCGHSGPINDIKWNPFDDLIIASCSDDMTIKVWEIPELGLIANMTEWTVELKGHGRRVTYIEWHPCAENILLSTGFDFRCIVWNVGSGEALRVIACHSTTIYSISWNYDGSLFATSCKDRKIRVIDPRTGCVLQEGEGHSGLKTTKVIFLKDDKLFTTGFSKTGDRELALWDATDLSDPLCKESIDYSSGVLLPFYEPDVDIIFLAGKGDGNIRFYEILDTSVNFLNEHPSPDPQRGMGYMPKKGLDVSKCEIARFYKLHTSKPIIEPLPMIVPRRSDEFQEDIYPPTAAGVPALSAQEWASGINRDPVLVSVKELAERGSTDHQSRVGTLRSARAEPKKQRVAPMQSSQPSPPPHSAPASLRNIYKLSTDPSKVEVKPTASHKHHRETTSPSPVKSGVFDNPIATQSRESPAFAQPTSQHLEWQQHKSASTAHVPEKYSFVREAPPSPTLARPLQSQMPLQEQGGQQQAAQLQGIAPSSALKWRENQAWQRQVAPVSEREMNQQNGNHHYPHKPPHQSSIEGQANINTEPVLSSATPGMSGHRAIVSPSSQAIPSQARQQSAKQIDGLLTESPCLQTTSAMLNISRPQPTVSPRQKLADWDHDMHKIGATNITSTEKPFNNPPQIVKHTPQLQGQGHMSEVERTIKLKNMKQKIQRSSSATQVELRKSSSPPAEHNSGTRTPPLTSSRSNSNESIDFERRRIIAEKLEELKRIRDLAKAYAEGKFEAQRSPAVVSGSKIIEPNACSAPSTPNLTRKLIGDFKGLVSSSQPRSESPLGYPNSTGRSSAPASSRNKKDVVSEYVLSPPRDIVTATVHPGAPSGPAAKASENTVLKQGRTQSSNPSTNRFPTGTFVCNAAPEIDGVDARRSSKFSTYDNEPLDEQLPKFPVLRCSADGSGTIYDNLQGSTRTAVSLERDQDQNVLPNIKTRSTALPGDSSVKVAAPVAPLQQTGNQHAGRTANITNANSSNNSTSLSNDELHKAYFKQVEEIKQLRQTLAIKDKQIERLENELAQLKKMIISF